MMWDRCSARARRTPILRICLHAQKCHVQKHQGHSQWGFLLYGFKEFQRPHKKRRVWLSSMRQNSRQQSDPVSYLCQRTGRFCSASQSVQSTTTPRENSRTRRWFCEIGRLLMLLPSLQDPELNHDMWGQLEIRFLFKSTV